MLHESKVIKETDHAAPKKAKLGVILFIFYTLIYGGFVIIGLVKPDLMGLEILGGQNVAIVYGFGLILLAVIMGFIYNYFCTRMENRMNKNQN
ncbi:MAG: DUF485 domain-containing protein [Bacteroidales bacterium]|nr:DUF485 domain-containing protein [Bacteroidales bacterium]